MSEKYYVVSESELDAYAAARSRRDEKIGGHHSEIEDASRRLKEMYEACRAREVRFIGAADQGSSLMLWGEVKK